MKKFIPLLRILGTFVVPTLAAPRPNILTTLADDLSYGDAGFNGCTDIPTPSPAQPSNSSRTTP